MTTLNYAPGDPIYIFGRRSTWGPGSFALGTVLRITDSGQIVCRLKDKEHRFNKRGRELGEYADGFILSKEEGTELAQRIREEVKRIRLRRATQEELERLRELDAADPAARTDLILKLRTLANALEAVS